MAEYLAAEMELTEAEYRMEIEQRMQNLCWTVSGDYSLRLKLDVDAFERSKYAALYDAIKQGAFAKYFSKEELGMYLVKKLYFGAGEQELLNLSQLCVDCAVVKKITKERSGVEEVRKKAFLDLLDQEFRRMTASFIGQVKFSMMKEAVYGSESMTARIRQVANRLYELYDATDTMEVIRCLDELYNQIVDRHFEEKYGPLETVLAVTMEELKEYNWKDFLEEELYEDDLERYLEQVTNAATVMQDKTESEDAEPPSRRRAKVVLVDEEAAAKMYSYIELNYGRSYLPEREQKRMNALLCRGAHADCQLYYTDGILSNMVRKNYQTEYARRAKEINLRVYGNHHRVARRNIEQLTDSLKRSLQVRNERELVNMDYGTIIPGKLWKIGRSHDTRLFQKEIRKNNSDFVVHVLIDASGSQRNRQSLVAIQGYMISEALSNVGIPHMVTGFCTFWDYTVLHRFRDYDEGREANRRIFEFHSSSNNRDGLAIRAAAYSLSLREEENKILIVLSDGRPNDQIVNRPNSKNPMTYCGDYAVRDTAFEVRKVRSQGISVLGVFAGEEQDLQAERKIFGKDFAYIRNIMNFSHVVGLYLQKQLDEVD